MSKRCTTSFDNRPSKRHRDISSGARAIARDGSSSARIVSLAAVGTIYIVFVFIPYFTNQCGRLIASVIIAYNSILLSALLERYRAAGDRKAIMLLRKISPVAWQHIHFLGRYLFRGNRQPIDLLALLADVAL
jgi:hypothetical protein